MKRKTFFVLGLISLVTMGVQAVTKLSVQAQTPPLAPEAPKPLEVLKKARQPTFVSSAAPAPAASKVLCDKDAVPTAVVAHKSDTSGNFELAPEASAGAVTRLAFVLNPCADIDLSQINDCRSGTCYSYCWSRISPYSQVYCAEANKWYMRKNWLKYVKGHPPNDCVPGGGWRGL